MKNKDKIQDVGMGWHKIIDSLIKNLEFIEEKSGITVDITQIKEKFGSLRFYYYLEVPEGVESAGWFSLIDDLVSYTEKISEQYCETCGKAGKIRNIVGWYKTLCDEHEIEAFEILERG